MSGGGTSSSEAQILANAYERYVAIYARCMSGARLSEADLSEDEPPPKRAMFDTAPRRQPRRVRYTGPLLLAIAIAARDAAQGQELRTPAALREELDRLCACPTPTPPPQAADPSERLTTMPACKS